MKSSTITLMLATAAMLVASTVASAQHVSAEIPFAFRANGETMAPGSYRLSASIGESVLTLRNVNGKTVLLTAGIRADAPQSWAKARRPAIEFVCQNGVCNLYRIWTASAPAHVYDVPRPKGDPGVRLAAIRLVTGRMD